MTLRYHSLLKIFSIRTSLQNVTAATFVSNGIGLWMPGSLAIIEVIRISLMLGAHYQKTDNYSDMTQIKNPNLAEFKSESLR